MRKFLAARGLDCSSFIEKREFQERIVKFFEDEAVYERIVGEIVSTERSYVRDLGAVIDVYVAEVEKLLGSATEQSFMTREQSNTLFGNLRSIHGLNAQLLRDLEGSPTYARHRKREAGEDPGEGGGDDALLAGGSGTGGGGAGGDGAFGFIFLRFGPFLQMYRAYISTYNTGGLQTLKDMERNGAFLRFCQAAEGDPRSRGLQLNSFLIMPIQRIPRYQLLLTELLKQTKRVYPARAAEIASIEKALGQVREVAGTINESVGTNELQNKVVQIAEILESVPKGHTLVIPTRSFIKSGPLRRQTRHGHEEYVFWLFNDLLIYGKKQFAWSAKFKIHRWLPLDTCIVTDVEGSPLEFQVQSPEKSFVVSAASADEKADWLEALTAALATLNKEVVKVGTNKKQSGHVIRQGSMNGSGGMGRSLTDSERAAAAAPVWTADKEAKWCNICSKEFTFIRRRHHCRQCGRVVCDACSQCRVLLPSVDKSKPVRVCDNCKGLKMKYKSLQHVRNSVAGSFNMGGGGAETRQHSAPLTTVGEGAAAAAGVGGDGGGGGGGGGGDLRSASAEPSAKPGRRQSRARRGSGALRAAGEGIRGALARRGHQHRIASSPRGNVGRVVT
eukprot:g2427.t1